MEQKPIVANYLVTRDDLYQFAAVTIKDQDKNAERWTCRIIGLVIVVFGLIGAIFLTNFILQRIIYLLLVFVGLAIGLFYNTLHLYLMRNQITAYVNHKKCQSETLFFYKTQIKFQLENYEATIPYKMLYQVIETKHVYIMKIGIDHIRYIPKRAITPEDCTTINRCFETELKENFKREGVR